MVIAAASLLPRAAKGPPDNRARQNLLPLPFRPSLDHRLPRGSLGLTVSHA